VMLRASATATNSWKVYQIETHGAVRCYLPSSQPKACSVASRLCRSGGSVNVPRCSSLACFSSPRRSCSRVSSRAVIGLGLPTVSDGPARRHHAALAPRFAIVIVPAVVTNIWQTFVGPYLRDIMRRLVAADGGYGDGIWLNAGMFDRPLYALRHHRSRRLAG